MPVYDFECPKGHEYEEALSIKDYDKPTKCPHCKAKGNKVIKARQSSPTFSDRLFPYYDKALNRVFQDKSQRAAFLKKKGYCEDGGKNMTAKQERMVLSMRNFDSHMIRNANTD